MPGETKIFKNSSGWYDVDNPSIFHATRAACRLARASQRHQSPATSTSTATNQTYAVTVQNFNTSVNTASSLNSLQQRLYDRLTLSQGVTPAEAFDVITTNGYNAAASYGHMREAGATHEEALSVINLGLPDVSLAYGLFRSDGDNHTDALQQALSPWTTHRWPVGGISDDD